MHFISRGCANSRGGTYMIGKCSTQAGGNQYSRSLSSYMIECSIYSLKHKYLSMEVT